MGNGVRSADQLVACCCRCDARCCWCDVDVHTQALPILASLSIVGNGFCVRNDSIGLAVRRDSKPQGLDRSIADNGRLLADKVGFNIQKDGNDYRFVFHKGHYCVR